MFHEELVTAEQLLARPSGRPDILPVRHQHPALGLVAQVGGHHLIDDLGMDGGVVDLDQGLDPTVEIAVHPVGRGDEHPGARGRQAVAVAQTDDPAVFEEAPDNRLDADVLAEPRHAGPQAADPADHHVDPHTCL